MRRLQVPGVAVGILADGQEQVAGFSTTTEATARRVGPRHPLHDRLGDQDLHRHRAHAAGRAGRVHAGHPRADHPARPAPGRRGGGGAPHAAPPRHAHCGLVGNFFIDTGAGAARPILALVRRLPKAPPQLSYSNAGLVGRGIGRDWPDLDADLISRRSDWSQEIVRVPETLPIDRHTNRCIPPATPLLRSHLASIHHLLGIVPHPPPRGEGRHSGGEGSARVTPCPQRRAPCRSAGDATYGAGHCAPAARA